MIIGAMQELNTVSRWRITGPILRQTRRSSCSPSQIHRRRKRSTAAAKEVAAKELADAERSLALERSGESALDEELKQHKEIEARAAKELADAKAQQSHH